jgi:ketosteroid isomerase-like protein
MTTARCIAHPLQRLLPRRARRADASDRSRDDVQLVQDAYQLTLDRSDPRRTAASIDRFVSLLSASVVFVPETAATPQRGREAIRRLLADAAESWNSVRYEVEEILDLGGGDVLACGRVLARSDEHRGRSEVPFANRWTIRAGRAVRIDSFSDRGEALEALGPRR